MGVPKELLVNCHVFCYSSDLRKASEDLATRLGCSYSLIYSTGCDINDNALKAEVAWLVGHGSSSDNKVGTKYQRDKALKITDITTWLNNKNTYKSIVDTCCQPELRKVNHGFIGNFNCSRDGHLVRVNSDFNTLDLWWDSEMI